MQELVKLCLLEHEFEAEILAEVLRKRSIPHMIKTLHDSAYDGLFQSTMGWGWLYAPPAYQEEIAGYLSDIRKGDVE